MSDHDITALLHHLFGEEGTPVDTVEQLKEVLDEQEMLLLLRTSSEEVEGSSSRYPCEASERRKTGKT